VFGIDDVVILTTRGQQRQCGGRRSAPQLVLPSLRCVAQQTSRSSEGSAASGYQYRRGRWNSSENECHFRRGSWQGFQPNVILQ